MRRYNYNCCKLSMALQLSRALQQFTSLLGLNVTSIFFMYEFRPLNIGISSSSHSDCKEKEERLEKGELELCSSTRFRFSVKEVKNVGYKWPPSSLTYRWSSVQKFLVQIWHLVLPKKSSSEHFIKHAMMFSNVVVRQPPHTRDVDIF